MRRRIALLAVLALAYFAPPAMAGQGTVNGTTVTSTGFPVGTIAVPAGFTYIGTTEFVLYGVADCEIHLFAELDGKEVKRHYWIQFEGYLPANAHRYDYAKDPQDVRVGSEAFHTRTWIFDAVATRPKMRAGSDSEAVAKLFEAKGLTVGPGIMQVRLVKLDEAKRRELMVIYAERLAPTGFTAADLAEGGKAFAEREKVLAGLKRRAAEGLALALK